MTTTLGRLLAGASLAATLAACAPGAPTTPSATASPSTTMAGSLPVATQASGAPITSAGQTVVAGTGAPAPLTPFLDFAGKAHNLAEYQGKYVLVSFFAYWCPHCQEDLPKVQALYSKQHADNFVWLPIEASADQLKETMGFAETYKITQPVFYDPTGAIAKSFGVTAFPTSRLILPDGTLGVSAVGDITPPDLFKLFMPPS